MVNLKSVSAFVLWFVTAFLLAGNAVAGGNQKALPILQSWQGDYPVTQLERLPKGQRSCRTGYLGNPSQFTMVWKVFKPMEKVPDVDFSDHMVVFSRNVTFYNRTAIHGSCRQIRRSPARRFRNGLCRGILCHTSGGREAWGKLLIFLFILSKPPLIILPEA
jgi:hypothetical protein